MPDEYTIRARIAPVLIVMTPAALFVGLSTQVHVRLALISGAVGTALLVLMAQMGRDAGKAREPHLWQQWGGSPTIQKLRWRHATDLNSQARTHALVAAKLGYDLPTRDEETRDPDSADRAYERAIAILRERTRDKSKFPLVFSENADYGFRRNLLGLRRGGSLIAGGTLLASAALVASGGGSHWRSRLEVQAPAFIVAALWLALYGFLVCPDWVRVPAFAYAERLIAALETFDG